MKILFKLFFSIVLLVIILTVATGGYFGFIPVISDLFGSNKPRDLGIVTSEQDASSAKEKSGVSFESIVSTTSPTDSLKFEGSTKINTSFTDKEVMAYAFGNKWKYNILPGAHLKFNPDGSLEVAGTLRVDRLPGYAKAHKIPEADIKQVLDAVKLFPTNPPIYIKANPTISNNQVSIDVQKITVGKLELPSTLTTQNSGAISSFVQEKIFKPVPGLDIQDLKISDSKLVFKGTFPKTIQIAK